MLNDKFYKNSLILTISNSTMGILKFVFSIILSKQLGPEGIGLYGLIMPIYDLFSCLVCGGLTTAVSKEEAVFFSNNDFENLNKSVKTCLQFDFMWSLIVAIIVFMHSPFISFTLIKDKRALYSIQIICPALVFIALSSIIKGYFYGISKVNIPAIIDIVEKALRITIVIAIINIFFLKEITKTVTVVYFALACGEMVSFIILYSFFKIYSNKYSFSHQKSERRSQLLFNILIISVPLCINGFLSTALYTVSALIVPRRLVSTGIPYSEALSLIGKFLGMALNISTFPAIIITSISTVLVPDISQNMDKKDYYSLGKRIKDVIKISLFLGMATLIVCIIIPDSLGKLFYNRTDLGPYIAFGSLASPFVYVSMTTYSILSGLGKQTAVLKNSLITSVEDLIILYIFTGIRSINVYGFGISLIITSITTTVLNMYEISKKSYITFTSNEIFSFILISAFAFFTLAMLNNTLSILNPNIKSIFIIMSGFAIFIYSLFKSDNKSL